jgi:hypothetical protein
VAAAVCLLSELYANLAKEAFQPYGDFLGNDVRKIIASSSAGWAAESLV